MRFKDNTIGLMNLQPQLILVLIVIDQVMKQFGQEAMITSINDARHSRTSLHYAGFAVDLRSRWFSDPQAVVDTCIQALGNSPDIDIILESNHIHCEVQFKRKS